MTPTTPPAVSEAMREAVAQVMYDHDCAGLGPLWTWGQANEKERVEYFARTDAILSGPIASEIARLTGERDAAQKKLAVATETFTDDDGAVWSPPTAWAYFAACRALKTVQARAEAAEADLTRMRAETERLRIELNTARYDLSIAKAQRDNARREVTSLDFGHRKPLVAFPRSAALSNPEQNDA